MPDKRSRLCRSLTKLIYVNALTLRHAMGTCVGYAR